MEDLASIGIGLLLLLLLPNNLPTVSDIVKVGRIEIRRFEDLASIDIGLTFPCAVFFLTMRRFRQYNMPFYVPSSAPDRKMSRLEIEPLASMILWFYFLLFGCFRTMLRLRQYNMPFYLQYLTTWPEYFLIKEAPDGTPMGYSECCTRVALYVRVSVWCGAAEWDRGVFFMILLHFFLPCLVFWLGIHTAVHDTVTSSYIGPDSNSCVRQGVSHAHKIQ